MPAAPARAGSATIPGVGRRSDAAGGTADGMAVPARAAAGRAGALATPPGPAVVGPPAAGVAASGRAGASAPPTAMVALQREHLARMPPGGTRSGSTR